MPLNLSKLFIQQLVIQGNKSSKSSTLNGARTQTSAPKYISFSNFKIKWETIFHFMVQEKKDD